MNISLKIKRVVQQTNYSCVPACLEQILSFYNIPATQNDIMNSMKYPERGMSLPQAGSFLIKKGLSTKIIINNINIFDPSWYSFNNDILIEHLNKRKKYLDIVNQSIANDYIIYLKNGGKISFETISPQLIYNVVSKNQPIITELSSTFLYKMSKTTEPGKFNNSIKGDVEDHGVVISGVKTDFSKFHIVDPGKYNPFKKNGIYWIRNQDLIASIFLANGKSILFITKK